MSETPIEVAVRLADLLVKSAVEIPDDCVVAVFVFRNEPEIDKVHIGFASTTTKTLLRRWIESWLSEPEDKETAAGIH